MVEIYNTNKETVSVIIPTYNRMQLLGRSIKSVINQTYQDLEIIVVDDCSTDDTEKLIREFQKQDERITSIRHDRNKGGSAARNSGIMAAKGKFIAFQDSDDEWLPEKLEKQMGVFQNADPQVGVVYTGFWRNHNNDKVYVPSSRVKQDAGFIHEILLRENFITTQSAVVKAECFKKAGMFNETLPRYQDWELWIRISKYYRFEFINEPLLNAFISSDSISVNQKAEITACKIILQNHYHEFKKAGRRVLADMLYSTGNLICQHEDVREGRKYLFEAFRVMPRVKYSIALFMSFLSRKTYSDITKVKKFFLPVQK